MSNELPHQRFGLPHQRFGLPHPITELTFHQELRMREIELELEREQVPQQYADIIRFLIKQNMILSSNITNLVKGYNHVNPNNQ